MSAKDLIDDCRRDDWTLFMQQLTFMMVVFILVIVAVHEYREVPEPVIHCPPLHHVYHHMEDGVPHYFCLMNEYKESQDE